MILIAVAFLFLVILLVRQYRGQKLMVYLVMLVLCWLAAFTASVLIIGNQSAFFLIGRRLLPLDWFIIRRIPVMAGRSSFLVTVLNVSTAGFYYCLLTFALTMSAPSPKNYRWLIRMSIVPPLLIAIILDPLFVELVSRTNATAVEHQFVSLAPLFQLARQMARAIFAAYLVAGIGILVRYCWDRPRTRRIQRSITYMATATSLFAMMFAFFFYRSPQLLVIPTFRDPFVRIGFYEIHTSIRVIRVFPLTQIAVIIFLVIGIARFLRLATSDTFYDTRIRHSLRAASLGSRVIGHAVKNQLFAIESGLKSLRSQVPEGWDEITKQLTELAAMCNQTYTSMGKTIEMLRVPRLRIERCNIVPLIVSTAVAWNRSYLDADVCFFTRTSNASAYIDRSHLAEVLVNLLNNAHQASQEHDTTRILIEIIVDNHWIHVRITDHGRGVDATDTTELFDPFFTENAGTSNWGVGLTYCRSIIDAHDGVIEIRRADSGGAEVEFSIPRAL